MKTTDITGRKFGIVRFVIGPELAEKGVSGPVGYHLTRKRYRVDEDMGREWYCGVEEIYWPLNDERFGLVRKTRE